MLLPWEPDKGGGHTWNGDHSKSVFGPKKWMVIGPNGPRPNATCPEGGDIIETSELKRRFQSTLQFLKENDRPYWKTIVAQQGKFLASLEGSQWRLSKTSRTQIWCSRRQAFAGVQKSQDLADLWPE